MAYLQGRTVRFGEGSNQIPVPNKNITKLAQTWDSESSKPPHFGTIRQGSSPDNGSDNILLLGGFNEFHHVL